MNQQQQKWIEDDIYDLIAEVQIAEKSLEELLRSIKNHLSIIHGEIEPNKALNELIKKIEDEQAKLNK